MVPCIITLY